MNISKSFVTAGNATFTVSNGKGDWYTFRARRPKARKEGVTPPVFMQLLTGPDNRSDYTYLGVLDEVGGFVRLTGASKLGQDTQPMKVLAFALRIIWGKQQLPEGYTIQHAGRCGACGRKLTVPSSIETGLGPECAGRITEQPNHKKAA